VIVALLLLAVAPSRQERFQELLRTYAQRPPAETFREVAQLVDEGSFESRDRAEYWMGSARLALGDGEGAREWFSRLSRDYPGSVWDQRGWLGLGDAASSQGRYGEALDWYGKAQGASDAAVRELGGIDLGRARTMQLRQRLAWAAGLVALAIVALLAAGTRGRNLLPIPAEARIVVPVLAVLAVLSARVDPAPRAAVLTLCAGGGALSYLCGVRLRIVRGARARLGHAVLALVALACVAYVAVYRANLVSMVVETFRAGPD
jgi:tetratricopeptide (TPR) repeat protein